MKNMFLAVVGLALLFAGIYLGGAAAFGSWIFVAAICYAIVGDIKYATFASAVVALLFALATGDALQLTQAWSAAALMGAGLFMAIEYGEKDAQPD